MINRKVMVKLSPCAAIYLKYYCSCPVFRDRLSQWVTDLNGKKELHNLNCFLFVSVMGFNQFELFSFRFSYGV